MLDTGVLIAIALLCNSANLPVVCQKELVICGKEKASKHENPSYKDVIISQDIEQCILERK